MRNITHQKIQNCVFPSGYLLVLSSFILLHATHLGTKCCSFQYKSHIKPSITRHSAAHGIRHYGSFDGKYHDVRVNNFARDSLTCDETDEKQGASIASEDSVKLPFDVMHRTLLCRKVALQSMMITSLGASFIPKVSLAQSITSREVSQFLAVNCRNRTVQVPRVGYSFYKTDPKTTPRCLELAIQAGVRHLDVGTLYGSNHEIGEALPDILRANQLRRKDLFISHKLSNEEQSNDRKQVKQVVMKAIKELNAGAYLDCVYIHSPLTDRERRIATYEALCELQESKKIKLVGVCHFGVPVLQELVDHGLPPPSIIQLSLSPFNQHKKIADWAKEHNCILSCAAWSKLSSVQGPQEGWAVLSNIAKHHSVTKAQVLVRWSLQRGYLSVPRSGVGSKIERVAIQENSYRGVSSFSLSDEEMEILNGLDVGITAGTLGLLDGWVESDIKEADWDPTFFC